MRDLRSGPLDKEATEPPADDLSTARGVIWESPDPGPDRRERRRRRALLAGVSALALAGAAACVLVWTGEARPLARSAQWFLNPPPAVLVGVTPTAGADEVRLDAPVRVSAEHGHLTEVEVVTEGGERLEGKLTRQGRHWQSTAPLRPGTSYEVRWSAVNVRDEPERDAAGFTTLTPAAELEFDLVLPLEGETVGVGQPVVLGFSHPVADKAAVERALKVTNSENPVGAWSWHGDDQIRYRPAQYWPVHSTVDVTADFAGLDAGDGVWGVEDWSLSFAVGAKQVSTVDVTTHQMTVEVGGEVVREMPMSAGRPGWETQNGVHTVLEKTEFAIFSIPGLYRKPVSYAVRLTSDGEYVHAAPWSVGDQGNTNVSHGCINLSTEDAGWFFAMAQRGDVVEVVGSTKEPMDSEGLIEWNQSFVEWGQGSALAGSHSSARPI